MQRSTNGTRECVASGGEREEEEGGGRNSFWRRERVSRGLNFVSAWYYQAGKRDWHCEELSGGGGVSYEIHVTFTAFTGWAPAKTQTHYK